MSRRRNTTARMFSGGKTRGPKRLSQSRATTPDGGGGRDDNSAPAAEPLTAEALRRHLAEEALLRDSSEMRTATVLKRYLKLTLALAGINALVAGATMVALWSRSDTSPRIVTDSSAPVALSKPELSIPAPPSPAPVVPPAAPVRSASVPAVAPRPDPASKPEVAAPVRRPRRPAVKPQVVREPVEDTEAVALQSAVERW